MNKTIDKIPQALEGYFTNGKWKPHFDLDEVWVFESGETWEADMQISWSLSEDWGPKGFQIADNMGKEIYMGMDPVEAKNAILDYIEETYKNI